MEITLLIEWLFHRRLFVFFLQNVSYYYSYGDGYGTEDTSSRRFIGSSNFFVSRTQPGVTKGSGDNAAVIFGNLSAYDGYAHFFFNYTFAATAASIVSGAVAERCSMGAYFAYSAFLSGFVYPVVAHWVWSGNGWLCAWFKDDAKYRVSEVGAIDFAGSGVVHLTGAVAALCGAFWLGPRRGRFDENTGEPQEMPSHSATMQVLGTFFLWIGWYGFNCGTVFTFGFSAYAFSAGRIAVTTTLAAAAGAITSMAFAYYKKPGEYDLNAINNGALGGLVSITAGCATVAPWAAVLIGMIGGLVYQFGSWLALSVMKIDDVVDAIAVHGWCGIWGCVAAGLFSRRTEMQEVYGSSEQGAFYGEGNVLAANITLCIAVIAWTGTFMNIFFGALWAMNMLRVTEKEEEDGLDASHHGGAAYNTGDVEMAKVPTTEEEVAKTEA